jgi:hypothetical protein
MRVGELRTLLRGVHEDSEVRVQMPRDARDAFVTVAPVVAVDVNEPVGQMESAGDVTLRID